MREKNYKQNIFSCILVIMRTFAVSLLAAHVNDESKKPLKMLRSVPSCQWNPEAKRFFDEVVSNKVALSGKEFFFITRKLILNMAGNAFFALIVIEDDFKYIDFCI